MFCLIALVSAEFDLKSYKMDTVCYGDSQVCTKMAELYTKEYWEKTDPGRLDEIQNTMGIFIHVGQKDFQDSLAQTRNYLVSVILTDSPTSGYFDLSKLRDRTVVSFTSVDSLNSKMLDDEVERHALKLFLDQIKSARMLRKQAELRHPKEESGMTKMFTKLSREAKVQSLSNNDRNDDHNLLSASPMAPVTYNLPLTCTSDCYSKVDYLMISSCLIRGSNVGVPAVYVDNVVNILDRQMFEKSEYFLTGEFKDDDPLTDEIPNMTFIDLGVIVDDLNNVIFNDTEWEIEAKHFEGIIRTEQVKRDFSILVENDPAESPYYGINFYTLEWGLPPFHLRGLNISVQGKNTILKSFRWNEEPGQPVVRSPYHVAFESFWDRDVANKPQIVLESDGTGFNVTDPPSQVELKYTLIKDRIVGKGRQELPPLVPDTDYPDGSTEGGNSTGGPEDGGTGGGDGDPDNKTGIIVGVVIAVIAVIAIVVVVVVCVVRKRKARVFGDIDVNGDDHQETQNEENNDEPCDTHESRHCEDGRASCEADEGAGDCGEGDGEGDREGEGEGGQNDPEAPGVQGGDPDGPE